MEELCLRWRPRTLELGLLLHWGQTAIGGFDLWLLGSGPFSPYPGGL